jgi:hypothetical protein
MHAKFWMNNISGRDDMEEGEVDVRSQGCG